MNNPITITPQDIVNVILAICGAIITIAAAFTVIYKLVKQFTAPDVSRDEKIAELEKKVAKINERLDEGDARFKKDYERMDNIEESFSEVMKIVLESLQALTAHALDGNNTEELKKAKNRLSAYLVDKV